ncbi:hypothetical protein POSPLADRAFT_1106308, partial [Postia placenta MAD-698-R-SB12]
MHQQLGAKCGDWAEARACKMASAGGGMTAGMEKATGRGAGALVDKTLSQLTWHAFAPGVKARHNKPPEISITRSQRFTQICVHHAQKLEELRLLEDARSKPPRSAVKSLQEELDHGFAFSKATKEDFETSTPYRKPPLPPVHPSSSASKASRAKHTVTFAPEVPERRSPRKPVDVRMSMDAREDIAPEANKVPAPRSPILKKPTPIKKLPSDTVFMTADSGRTNKYDTKDKAVGVQEIVDVLQDLQEAVMQKIARRFEGVRDDVRAGREAILAEAAADLLELRTERRVHLP